MDIEQFIKAKYNLEFTAGDDHIYIEYLEKELKKAWEKKEKLKKENAYSMGMDNYKIAHIEKMKKDLWEENEKLKEENKNYYIESNAIYHENMDLKRELLNVYETLKTKKITWGEKRDIEERLNKLYSYFKED